jgi:dolichol-phosphate mannosyltransferase
MPKTVVVVPTYNERENLPKMAEALLKLGVQGLEVLIVDDGSPDGTGQIADELVAQHKGFFHVMHRSGKQGLGTAYIQGFGWAINHGADQIVQMDADFSHDPNDVPRLLAELPNHDFVIGSRYTKGGKLDERWSFLRRLLSWWANRVWVNVVLGTRINDSTAGFRAWRRATLLGMGLSRVKSNGYVFQVEMAYLARRLGYSVKEVPIYFADRRYGESKMGVSITIEAAMGVFGLRARYSKYTAKDRAVEVAG